MTTPSWIPITRDHPDVIGIDPDDDSRLEVQVTLSTVPAVEWAERFTSGSDTGTGDDGPTPTVKGKTVTIRPTDSGLAEAVADVDARIADANTYFQSEVLPEVEASLAEQEKQDDEALGDRDEDGRVRAARLQAQSL